MLDNNYSSCSFLNKVSMLLLALLPILAWYRIPFPLSLGNTLVLFISTYVIIRNAFRVNCLPTSFWVVFIYVCLIWMYNHQFKLWTLLPPGGWVFFIFVLTLQWGVMTFNKDLLIKYMRWIIYISGCLFWIQFIFMITTGTPRICFVPNLTGSFTYEGFTYAELVSKQMNGGLPCSIFLEKSYLAYYFLTFLSLIWFDKKYTTELYNKEILFVIITLFASRSGSALVGFMILFVVKIFYILWSSNIKKKVIVILLIPLLLGFSFLYFKTEFGQHMLSRTNELSTEGSSGYTRVVGGYLMFEQLSSTEKIFGIPDAEERFAFKKANGNYVFYVNGMQSILLKLGYIGTFLYLLFYINIFRRAKIVSRLSIIVLLVMSLLESNYLNPYMALLTIIPCSELYLNRNKVVYEKNNASLRHPSRSN